MKRRMWRPPIGANIDVKMDGRTTDRSGCGGDEPAGMRGTHERTRRDAADGERVESAEHAEPLQPAPLPASERERGLAPACPRGAELEVHLPRLLSVSASPQ